MKKIILATLVFACFNLMNISNASAQKPTVEQQSILKSFPETMDGYERYVIYPKKNKKEENLKIEIIPGKLMEVDCNNQRLMGTLAEKDVKGMGYTYYVFESNGQVASTMMFCPDPKTEKFVTGETTLIGYNSKMPVVVFVPEGMTLKYKIWKADKEKSAIQE